MAKHVYAIEIPLADGYTMYEICRCDSPEKVAEILRILLSAEVRCPESCRVVLHPSQASDDALRGQA